MHPPPAVWHAIHFANILQLVLLVDHLQSLSGTQLHVLAQTNGHGVKIGPQILFLLNSVVDGTCDRGRVLQLVLVLGLLQFLMFSHWPRIIAQLQNKPSKPCKMPPKAP